LIFGALVNRFDWPPRKIVLRTLYDSVRRPLNWTFIKGGPLPYLMTLSYD
jgi:hypothetical protein